MLKAVIRLAGHPTHLFNHRNIFLFSHMRANTSLFGHILGSHPDIEGYYEMHIGYYSWKSLWRQKLLYLDSHKPKPTSHIMFDKLLHDYCVVAKDILSRQNTQCIFMLRGPKQSIKSIVGLYQKIDASHEYATIEGANNYYINRLAALSTIADTMKTDFYYLDAENIINSPTNTLEALSKWLNLSQPLSSEYKLFNKTGAPQAGDPSDLMNTGRINKIQHNYEDITLPTPLLIEANAAYQKTRSAIISNKHNQGDKI